MGVDVQWEWDNVEQREFRRGTGMEPREWKKSPVDIKNMS